MQGKRAHCPGLLKAVRVLVWCPRFVVPPLKAADRIFGLLPEDQAKKFRALWDEFEAEETAESKFAHTMDNIQPAMLNNSTNGRVWEENKIKLSQILERNKNTPEGSKTLWDYSLNNFIMPSVENKKILDDKT